MRIRSAYCVHSLLPNKPKTAEETLRDARFAAWELSKQVAQSQLKAPSTAEFPKFSDDRVFYTNDSIFTINSYVDAQNEYGSMIRTKFVCNVKYAGGDADSSRNWTVMAFTPQ